MRHRAPRCTNGQCGELLRRQLRPLRESETRRAPRYFRTKGRHSIAAAVLLLLITTPAARAQYIYTNVADSNDPTISAFGGTTPSINSAGTLGFWAFLDVGGQGIFTGNGTTTTTIALTTGLPYAAFGNVSPASFTPISTAGALGFRADLDAGGHGLFRSDGTTTTTIALDSGPIYSYLQPPPSRLAINPSVPAEFMEGGCK